MEPDEIEYVSGTVEGYDRPPDIVSSGNFRPTPALSIRWRLMKMVVYMLLKPNYPKIRINEKLFLRF
jgi:hypothetical protein